tara:strand:- start:219 stop:335 length:117 start_codon:yes stop_codon:yes gene_type:complete
MAKSIINNFRKKPKVKRKGVHSKNLSKSQRKKPSKGQG